MDAVCSPRAELSARPGKLRPTARLHVMLDLVVRSRPAITPEGERPAAVAVREWRVVAVEGYYAPLLSREDG
jgi:hypothetical protein